MSIFQSPRRVAIALRDNTLSEREKLNFLWVLFALSGIFGEESVLVTIRALSSGYGLLLAVPWIILIWGTIASYRANRRGDNQNFIERFIGLTASLSVRAYLVYAILLIPIHVLSRLIFSSQFNVFPFLTNQLVVIGMTLYIYVRLKSLMVIAAGSRGQEGAPNSETEF